MTVQIFELLEISVLLLLYVLLIRIFYCTDKQRNCAEKQGKDGNDK